MLVRFAEWYLANLQVVLTKATSNVALPIFYQATLNVIHAADEVRRDNPGLPRRSFKVPNSLSLNPLWLNGNTVGTHRILEGRCNNSLHFKVTWVDVRNLVQSSRSCSDKSELQGPKGFLSWKGYWFRGEVEEKKDQEHSNMYLYR